jgi:hypothetical protein
MSVDDYENPTALQEAINRLFVCMLDVECDSDEYSLMANQLVKLYKMKEIEDQLRLKELELKSKQAETEAVCELRSIETLLKRKELDRPNRIGLDTWATIGGHVLGIVIIVGYERVNVITSKALGFVTRLK